MRARSRFINPHRIRHYPIFADVAGRCCVVVGGGGIAQRKTAGLLAAGARVTVVSPSLTPRLAALARAGTIEHRRRVFRVADLRGAWLVCAATDDETVNRLVSRAATTRRIFANVVDQTERCSFIAPAVIRRGGLAVAISTGGRSPALAQRLRRDLERLIDARRYAPMLRFLAGLRKPVQHRLAAFEDRKRFFHRLVDDQTFRLIREGKRRAAHVEAQRLLSEAESHDP